MVSIAFTGGGTGGHIYPGLAVAAELQRLFARSGKECRIFWIGSKAAMDRSIVEGAGLEFFAVPSGKLRRYFSLRNCIDLFKVAAGFFAARKILKREKPVLLFSKGGFVSVPPCAAAAGLGIPVCTHESDFSPGLATRLNTRFVSRTGGRIFTAYEETAAFLPAKIRERLTVSGNPVRREFRSADAALGRAFLGTGPSERILLVLGGSLGAAEINDLVRRIIGNLNLYYTVVHQTGSAAPSGMPSSRQYRPYPFIREEMPHVLAAAELVLGRSGAGTVWECAAAGKPMLLLPLRGAVTRGDQVENARFFEKAGAALVFEPQGEGPAASAMDAWVSATVKDLAENGEKRAAMAAAAKRIGEKDGASITADSLLEYTGEA